MAMSESEHQAMVDRARAGDRVALEELVRSIQDRVYALSMRMLGLPAEAQDACQEILVKVVTNLASFRGDSAFGTWVHRIAVNHLLQTRRRGMEMPMEDMAALIDGGNDDDAPTLHDQVLAAELRIGCTQAMLCCLDRDHRIAFILGEILELSGEEAAEIVGINPAAYRKRLSRARESLADFMKNRCGVFDENAKCRCSKRLGRAVKSGLVDPQRPVFMSQSLLDETSQQRVLQELVGLLDVGKVFRRTPDFKAPEAFLANLRELLRSSPLN
jgi:RNA polymerase sigma factor (sigma-70 family)